MARTILVVEDSAERIRIFKEQFAADTCTVVSSYCGAVTALYGFAFDEIWLDYDLGVGRLSGADVAEWMVENLPPDRRPRVIVHSAHAVGAITIAAILRRAGFDVQQRPWNSVATFAEDAGR